MNKYVYIYVICQTNTVRNRSQNTRGFFPRFCHAGGPNFVRCTLSRYVHNIAQLGMKMDENLQKIRWLWCVLLSKWPSRFWISLKHSRFDQHPLAALACIQGCTCPKLHLQFNRFFHVLSPRWERTSLSGSQLQYDNLIQSPVSHISAGKNVA